MRTWKISVAAAIASVALVASQLDTILSVAGKWIAPYVAPYLAPHAVISVALGADFPSEAEVAVAEPSNKEHAIAGARVQPGKRAALSIPANYRYTIAVQGTGFQASSFEVWVLKGESVFTLVRTGGAGPATNVSLRESGPDSAELSRSDPSAALLLSAQALQAASQPSNATTVEALPELDRAAQIVGLFETGTTQCARLLAFVPDFRAGSKTKVPAIGCLGFSIPGWLVNVIVDLDEGEAHRLDAILGADAVPVRKYARDAGAVIPEAQLRTEMEHLVAAPEFWIAYQTRVLDLYRQAADFAREVGLVSERGRLLLFDRLVNVGRGGVARAIRDYTERYPSGMTGAPNSEAERVRLLGEIFKADVRPPFAAAVARRVDTITNGHGSIRGITFDLGQLGVSEARPEG